VQFFWLKKVKKMEFFKEWSQINQSRENMYRFLARIFRIEADKDFLKQLSVMEFPGECPEEMREGYCLLAKSVKMVDESKIMDLAVDYARVFLGAGIVDFDAAYPYESVYTSPKKLIMQEARDEVVDFYQQCGIIRNENINDPEDHIAFELEFMAYLCQVAVKACQEKKEQDLYKIMQRQQEFLSGHIMKWADDFCNDVLKYSSTDFYQGAAHITKGYLHMELDFMQEEAIGA